MAEVKSDIDIARSITPRNITEVASKIGLKSADLKPYGYDKAKVDIRHG